MMKRILFLNDVPGELGGGEYQLIRLSRGLRAQGWDVEVACIPNSPLSEKLAEISVPTHSLPALRSNPLVAIGQLKRLCAERSIGLVQTSSFLTDFVGRLAGRLASRPVVTTVHCEPDAYRLSAPGVKRSLLYRLRRGVDYATRPLTTQFIAVSKAVAKKLEATGVDKSRITVVSNGIDTLAVREAARTPRAKSKNEGRFCVGIMARFDPVKGLDIFIRSVAALKREVPGITTLIIGDGPLRGDLERLVDELELRANVTFFGSLDNPYPVMNTIDVHVVSSFSEGQNMTVLDAMALGKPVVATAVGGITDMIEDGESGLLVPPADPPALAAAIKRVLDDDRLAAKLTTEGLKRVERFTAEEMVSKTIEVYQRVLA